MHCLQANSLSVAACASSFVLLNYDDQDSPYWVPKRGISWAIDCPGHPLTQRIPQAAIDLDYAHGFRLICGFSVRYLKDE